MVRKIVKFMNNNLQEVRAEHGCGKEIIYDVEMSDVRSYTVYMIVK